MDSAKKLVNSLITSRLDYCNSLLAGVGDTQLKRLQKVQNCAARVVLKLPRSVSPPLHQLHWLPIEQRVKFKTAVLVFKALNGLAPSYLSGLLRSAPVRSLRIARNDLLHIPKTKLTTGGDRSFYAYGPKIWNSIPQATRNSKDLVSFKKHLKTFYYCEAFK